MPIYQYECIYCQNGFDEISDFKGSGKTECPKCGNVSFKVPATFTPRIFKKRTFGDGSATPPNVATHSQEKLWMKKEGITYEPAKSDIKYDIDNKRKKQSLSAMETAFHDAHKIAEQGG